MIVPCIHKTVLQAMDFLRTTLLLRLANHSSHTEGTSRRKPKGPSTGSEYRERDVQERSFWTTLGTMYSGLVKCPSKVSERKRIWRTVLPIALLMLLIGTTLGGVWHRHAICSADACPICHLSHQAIAPTPASTRGYILVPTGPGPEPQHYSSILSPAAGHIPARAPPA